MNNLQRQNFFISITSDAKKNSNSIVIHVHYENYMNLKASHFLNNFILTHLFTYVSFMIYASQNKVIYELKKFMKKI